MLHLNPYKNIKSILLVKTWTQYWPNIKKEIKYPGTGQSEITTKIYTEKHNSSSRDDHESEIEIMFQDFDSFSFLKYRFSKTAVKHDMSQRTRLFSSKLQYNRISGTHSWTA